MRKISVFISTLLIITMLCGCGSNSDKAKETISEIYEQTESVKPQAHYGISKNVYMVRHNEDDTYDYSPILGNNVSISEDDSVIAYGTTIECSWMDDSAIIPCRLMIFVDGVPIKFGLEYGKSDYYSEVEIANNKNSITRLYLDEESLKKVNSKIDLEIMCIPMADNTEWNNENIMMACDNLIHTRETCNDFSESEIENKTKTEMSHMKSVKSIIGRDLWEITRYTGHIRDFILQGIDGKYYYVGDYRNDRELTTYFMLDGNFIETDNGFYSIKWDGNDEYSVCELELPEMDEGTHILLAVTIVNEEDSFSAYRSEGTIIEKE